VCVPVTDQQRRLQPR